ncbi:DUF4142 domain-containing protein [Kribbella sp. NPDC051952]|uniref:DUF4142 domain-containing protein n=1 Tax=Kribbella sp. NPDC051952 TaxID=3154851 RepID=UPI0034441B2D
MPRRQVKTSTRVLALLLLLAAGVLATAQPATAATPQPDVAYLNAAHQLNLTIIQAAHAAKTQGKSSCVRSNGAVMERDHRRLAAQESEAAGRFGIELVTIPSQTERQQLDALAAKAGKPGYDAAWLALQRQEHQRYLALIDGDLPKSASPAVESLANGAKPVLQMHLRMVAGPCRETTESPTVPTGDGGQMADAQKVRSRIALALLGIGVLLLLIGKPIPFRRRLLGIATIGVGLAMVFGGQHGNAGEVPKAGDSAAEREAAIPPVKLAMSGLKDASVVPVATGSDGGLQVPKSRNGVGWWAAGAAPGSAGGTVLLAGHVDTTRGLGVFAGLSEVRVGSKVAVTSGDGTVHRYRIVARRIYQRDGLPSDLFHGDGKPRLALVTCIGAYNHTTHSYAQNLVLYGVPAERS